MGLSFLKKIGSEIAKGAMVGAEVLAQVEGFGPLLNAVLPPKVSKGLQSAESVASQGLGIVDDIIKQVEAVGSLSTLTGSQKFQAATGLARIAFSDVMSVAGHDIQDKDLLAKAQTEFADGIAKIVQARVDFLNSLKSKN